MAIEGIEKLKARVEKDPDSKLFVPLAEEYRKAGLYDNAIEILLNGLKRHPGYTTARVALGKIYLEKGQTNEALYEFEQVIENKPDNLFAQKKLAEIYRGVGNKDKVIHHYQKVLELNPLDEAAKEILTNLTEMVSMEKGTEEADDISFAETSKTSKAEKESLGEIELLSSEDIKELEEAFGDVEGFSLHEVADLASEEDDEYKEFSKFVGENVPLSEEEAVAEAGEDPYKKDIDNLIGKADEFINAGQYIKAIELYTDLLKSYPEDKRVRQCTLELKQYLTLLGKDTDDALINKLEVFLQRLRKRTE